MDFSQLKSLTVRELISALEKDGFLCSRTVGSHHRYIHEDGRAVTVTVHRASDTFPLGTLSVMLKHQIKWTEDDLRRLRLIK